MKALPFSEGKLSPKSVKVLQPASISGLSGWSSLDSGIGLPSKLEKSNCRLYKSPKIDKTSAGSEKATSLGKICTGGMSKNSLSFLQPQTPSTSAKSVIDNIFFIEIIYSDVTN